MDLSTRTDLIPLTGSRPPVLVLDGWTVYVAIHDQEYIRQRTEWRRRLAASHPDKSGLTSEDRGWATANRKFRNLLIQHGAWRFKERCFYWKLGLMPPDWRGTPAPPHGWRISSDKRLPSYGGNAHGR